MTIPREVKDAGFERAYLETQLEDAVIALVHCGDPAAQRYWQRQPEGAYAAALDAEFEREALSSRDELEVAA